MLQLLLNVNISSCMQLKSVNSKEDTFKGGWYHRVVVPGVCPEQFNVPVPCLEGRKSIVRNGEWTSDRIGRT